MLHIACTGGTLAEEKMWCFDHSEYTMYFYLDLSTKSIIQSTR